MTQIQNISWSFAEAKNFRVAAREHTLALPEGTYRDIRMSLKTCQSTPAIDAAIYGPDGTLYQLQPGFSYTIDGTGADVPLGGKEKNSTRQLPSLCSFPFVC